MAMFPIESRSMDDGSETDQAEESIFCGTYGILIHRRVLNAVYCTSKVVQVFVM